MLITEASHPILGNLLDGRYEIIQVLSAGAFGRTYIAKDTALPGYPKRVIKHVKPASNDFNFRQSVRRKFVNEVDILKRLGEHDRIPQVFTYFEDDLGFYCVQEFIEGHTLDTLLPTSPRCGKRWNENQAIELLQEVLGILEFVHSQKLIHSNIKPNNIIKRASDGKLFLIDFDSVQSIETLQEERVTSISPVGYVSPEKPTYQPRPNSDIHALGKVGIQALTGLNRSQLQADSKLDWRQGVEVSARLAAILDGMVQRYQSATEVLQALQQPAVSSQELAVSNQQLAVSSQELAVSNQEPEEIVNSTQNSFYLDPLTFLPPETPDSQPAQTSTVKSQSSQPQNTSAKKSPLLKVFGIGMVLNALVMVAGFLYISQPDPRQFKVVEQAINEDQWMAGAEKVCQIPLICFWQKNKQPMAQQKKPLTKDEVHRFLQKGFDRAIVRDFIGALECLEKIPPGSPNYDRVKTKIQEYRQKQRIKDAAKMAAISPSVGKFNGR